MTPAPTEWMLLPENRKYVLNMFTLHTPAAPERLKKAHIKWLKKLTEIGGGTYTPLDRQIRRACVFGGPATAPQTARLTEFACE